jgi:hypothetical protein
MTAGPRHYCHISSGGGTTSHAQYLPSPCSLLTFETLQSERHPDLPASDTYPSNVVTESMLLDIRFVPGYLVVHDLSMYMIVHYTFSYQRMTPSLIPIVCRSHYPTFTCSKTSDARDFQSILSRKLLYLPPNAS